MNYKLLSFLTVIILSHLSSARAFFAPLCDGSNPCHTGKYCEIFKNGALGGRQCSPCGQCKVDETEVKPCGVASDSVCCPKPYNKGIYNITSQEWDCTYAGSGSETFLEKYLLEIIGIGATVTVTVVTVALIIFLVRRRRRKTTGNNDGLLTTFRLEEKGNEVPVQT